MTTPIIPTIAKAVCSNLSCSLLFEPSYAGQHLTTWGVCAISVDVLRFQHSVLRAACKTGGGLLVKLIKFMVHLPQSFHSFALVPVARKSLQWPGSLKSKKHIPEEFRKKSDDD